MLPEVGVDVPSSPTSVSLFALLYGITRSRKCCTGYVHVPGLLGEDNAMYSNADILLWAKKIWSRSKCN
jgi:hypothetical protein